MTERNKDAKSNKFESVEVQSGRENEIGNEIERIERKLMKI